MAPLLFWIVSVELMLQAVYCGALVFEARGVGSLAMVRLFTLTMTSLLPCGSLESQLCLGEERADAVFLAACLQTEGSGCFLVMHLQCR